LFYEKARSKGRKRYELVETLSSNKTVGLQEQQLNDADLELLIYLDCMDLFQSTTLKWVYTLIVGITGVGTGY